VAIKQYSILKESPGSAVGSIDAPVSLS